MGKNIAKSIRKRILGHGRGWVFTPTHISDLGTATGVRAALSRLCKEKVIRRIAKGIYDYPIIHKKLGTLTPSANEIAKAIAEKNGAKIQASGAYAANLIGLSEQVPGKVVFLTDGPSGKVKINKLEITLKKTTVKNMYAAGSKEALVIQAFKFMGKDHIDSIILKTTKSFLKNSSKKDLEKNLKFAPQWIRDIILNLMDDLR